MKSLLLKMIKKLGNQELNEKTPKKSTAVSDEVPSAPKKAKKEEVKEADKSIESEIDGNEDIKDQIIVELKLKIDYQQKQIEDNKILKKKALTRDKTLKMLENTGIKNKALELENEDLTKKNVKLTETIEGLEAKIEAFDEKKDKGDSKSEAEEAEQLKQTLKRVRNDRQKFIEANKKFKLESDQRKAVIKGLDITKKYLEEEVEAKDLEIKRLMKRV